MRWREGKDTITGEGRIQNGGPEVTGMSVTIFFLLLHGWRLDRLGRRKVAVVSRGL